MPIVTALPPDERDAIVRILWEDAIARVTARDIPIRLQRGDEYVDLQCLEAGVQCVATAMCPTGGQLARKAVSAATWDKVIASLSSCGRRTVSSLRSRGF